MMMQQHTDVRRLMRAARRPIRRGLRGALVTAALLLGARLNVSAAENAHCAGLAPSCHIRAEALCLCTGPSWSSCRWQCVEKTRRTVTL